MTERILLSLFFPCLLSCATLVLIGIWTGEHRLPPEFFQTAATLFVIGLASFLSWFVLTLRGMATNRKGP